MMMYVLQCAGRNKNNLSLIFIDVVMFIDHKVLVFK